MKPYVCTYMKSGTQMGVTLHADCVEALMAEYGPHFPDLEVQGTLISTHDAEPTAVKKFEEVKDREQFRKFDEEKRLVYAEVYLPDVEDAHGHSMTRDEIEKMAHGFLASRRVTNIDVNHDNNVDYDCVMVESYIAPDGDPIYMPGSWVGVVKVNNDAIWKQIKDGELTGFSFEGLGYLVEEPA